MAVTITVGTVAARTTKTTIITNTTTNINTDATQFVATNTLVASPKTITSTTKQPMTAISLPKSIITNITKSPSNRGTSSEKAVKQSTRRALKFYLNHLNHLKRLSNGFFLSHRFHLPASWCRDSAFRVQK
jgi:hypothetical protein